jgi:hypothetical protein
MIVDIFWWFIGKLGDLFFGKYETFEGEGRD